MKRPIDTSLKVTVLLAALAIIALGGYFLYHYRQAAPPLHHKQPAFTASKTVADRTPVDTSQPAATVAPQPTPKPTSNSESSSTPASHTPSQPQPQTVAASGAASKATLPTTMSTTTQPTHSTTDNHRNPLRKLFGLLGL